MSVSQLDRGLLKTLRRGEDGPLPSLPEEERKPLMALVYALHRGETLEQYAKDAGRGVVEVVQRTRLLSDFLVRVADAADPAVQGSATLDFKPVKPPEVQLATSADVRDVFDTLMLQYQEVGITRLNAEKVLIKVASLCHKDGGAIGIIRGPDRIEGTIGLAINEFWYSDDPTLSETWHFVHADHRRSTHAKHLIDFACWFADSLGLTLFMSVVNARRLHAKERLYARKMRKIGAMFIHGKLDAPGLIDED